MCSVDYYLFLSLWITSENKLPLCQILAELVMACTPLEYSFKILQTLARKCW